MDLNKVRFKNETYTKYIEKKLEESKDAIRKGQVMSIEESIERMKDNFDSFNIGDCSNGHTLHL